jgi:hypothetical protein
LGSDPHDGHNTGGIIMPRTIARANKRPRQLQESSRSTAAATPDVGKVDAPPAKSPRQAGHDKLGWPITVGCTVIDETGYQGVVTHVENDAVIFRPVHNTDGDTFGPDDREADNAGNLKVVYPAGGNKTSMSDTVSEIVKHQRNFGEDKHGKPIRRGSIVQANNGEVGIVTHIDGDSYLMKIIDGENGEEFGDATADWAYDSTRLAEDVSHLQRLFLGDDASGRSTAPADPVSRFISWATSLEMIRGELDNLEFENNEVALEDITEAFCRLLRAVWATVPDVAVAEAVVRKKVGAAR